jgi:hypothetical protein
MNHFAPDSKMLCIYFFCNVVVSSKVLPFINMCLHSWRENVLYVHENFAHYSANSSALILNVIVPALFPYNLTLLIKFYQLLLPHKHSQYVKLNMGCSVVVHQWLGTKMIWNHYSLPIPVLKWFENWSICFRHLHMVLAYRYVFWKAW